MFGFYRECPANSRSITFQRIIHFLKRRLKQNKTTKNSRSTVAVDCYSTSLLHEPANTNRPCASQFFFQGCASQCYWTQQELPVQRLQKNACIKQKAECTEYASWHGPFTPTTTIHDYIFRNVRILFWNKINF